MQRFLLILTALLTLIFTSAPYAAAGFSLFGSHEKVKSTDGIVRLPVAAIADGAAHYYRYHHDGRKIKFFVVRSPDGVIRAAFDACDVCFPAKKGYSQDGDFMICNNCGRRFHVSRINVEKGGCNPAPLKRSVEGDYLVIAVGDIVSGSRYF